MGLVHWQDDWLTVYQGDCRAVMAEMPAESVHCVVTSPPYWSLRDYGTPGQIGLERSVGEYVEALVDVFRGVRRVMRRDATLWLNLGDSFGDKQLLGVPWRVAFALQADGWYLRSDIIWSKPNPMPESVTDRPTKSHEYLFLLSKSPRYYYDADAVREQTTGGHDNGVLGRDGNHQPGDRSNFDRRFPWVDGGSKNLRSVWTIATQPYPGAHFATFPRKLVEPCIKAGTSERGVCWSCGAPWVRGDVDWRPSCSHDYPATPATVLDPFAGSGTTALVAQSLGRRAILIDLSTDYLAQIMARNAQMPLSGG